MSRLAPCKDVLGRHDFQLRFPGILEGTLGIVVEKVLLSIRGSYQTIWRSPLTNDKWHSVAWPNTMTTLYKSGFILICGLFSPNSTFSRIMKVFNRTFPTVVACWQKTLNPPDTSFWACIWSYCYDIFSRILHQCHDLDPDLDLHQITRGFHWAFATGMTCIQGALTPLDTWSRPICELHTLTLASMTSEEF